MFASVPDIEDRHVRGRTIEHFLPPHQRRVAAPRIRGDHAGNIDGILRRPVLRRVAELGLRQVLDRGARLDRHRDDVDALLHALLAHGLGSQDPPGLRRKEQFHRQGACAREVPGMVAGMEIDPLVREPRALENLLRSPRAGGGHREDAADRGALDTPKRAPAAADDLGGHPPLPVRGARQGHDAPGARDDIARLDGIAHGPDMRIVRLHALVDPDAAAFAERDAGGGGQARLGSDADREDDDVGGNPRSRCGRHDDLPVRGLEAGDGIAQLELDPVLGEVIVQGLGHLRVERGHHLGHRLHDGHGDPSLHEVLGHLEPDEAATDDDGGPDVMLVDPRANPAAVGDGS